MGHTIHVRVVTGFGCEPLSLISQEYTLSSCYHHQILLSRLAGSKAYASQCMLLLFWVYSGPGCIRPHLHLCLLVVQLPQLPFSIFKLPQGHSSLTRSPAQRRRQQHAQHAQHTQHETASSSSAFGSVRLRLVWNACFLPTSATACCSRQVRFRAVCTCSILSAEGAAEGVAGSPASCLLLSLQV